MNIINISKNKYDSLKPYILPATIFNVEGKIFELPEKNKWETNPKLLKEFYVKSGIVFSNKLYTINTLIDNKEVINMEELIFPEHLAVVNKEIVGFTMPLIKSTDLKVMLDSYNVTNEDKIKYLKEIGEILRKMKTVREHTNVKDFYLNDMHENNFIVNSQTNKVNVIDLDSCKIQENKTFGSKYLSFLSPMYDVPKYQKIEEKAWGGSIVPDENTDLFCYNIMILNFLYGDNVNRLSLIQYYNYLDYLLKIGASKELLDIFAKIFTNAPNENPDYLLDTIKPLIGRAHERVYTKVYH